MKMILGYIRPHFKRMTVGIVIKLIGAFMDLLLPWFLAYMIDTVVPLENIPAILFWGGVMLVCAALALITNIAANRIATRVARDSTETLRQELFEKTLSLSCSQIDRLTIPSLESRLTTDTYNIYQITGMMQRLGIRAPILLFGGILVTLTLEPALTLVLVSVLPFIAVMVFLVSKKGIALYTKLQQAVDTLVRTVRENIAGIRVIKALSKTEHEKQKAAGINSDVTEKERKAGIVMALTNPAMNLFLNVGLTLVIVVGAFRVDAGQTQPGKIIAFLSYFTIILMAMMAITRIFVMYSKAAASAKRITEVFEQPEELEQEKLEQASQAAHVVFDHVSFSYHKKEHNLSDISFSLKRGETLGIIGATGSGKSTLIQLLMRLYDADSGRISIDGRPLQSIPQEELHTLFGVVFQNDVLFADSIEENISFGRDLSRAEVEEAAGLAQASAFIGDTADGFGHMLTSRGTNLSGGQKQRLLIARALAADPDILILDDSSSALDYATDARLRSALRKAKQGTTIIIIAQRVSSIRHADHILMLDEGKMLGYGTHEELMEDCGIYKEIHDLQMGEKKRAS